MKKSKKMMLTLLVVLLVIWAIPTMYLSAEKPSACENEGGGGDVNLKSSHVGQSWESFDHEDCNIEPGQYLWHLVLSPIDKNVSAIINDIMNNMSQEDLILQWYELELFRLSYASRYANTYGHGGELLVAGTAQALANALIGIETLDVKNLMVDWDHPEFSKRRKLILNYLNSAYTFFFTLCDSLHFIYKGDLEHWLTEALKASEQYLRYVDHFWNVQKNIELDKKYRKEPKPNYSVYYASFIGIDYILTYLMELARFFFDDSLKVEVNKEFFNIYNEDEYFNMIERILEQVQFYISDFKEHVKKGFFDINDDPLNDPTIKETIEEIQITKVYVQAMYTMFRVIREDNMSEYNILNKTVMPELFKYLEKYKPMMKDPKFLDSRIADGIALMLEELVFYSGVLAVKGRITEPLERVEREYSSFFADDAMKRYPRVNGLHTMLELTLEIKNNNFDNIVKHSDNLILLSKYAKYEPRKSFSYALMGYLLSLFMGQITREEFKQTMIEIQEKMLLIFPQKLSTEIEIYLTNLFLALDGELAQFDMNRLLSPKFNDPYSIFIPEISKLAKKKGYEELVYLPFNLHGDYLIDTDYQIVEEVETVSE